jgi:hypothetical protein
MKVSALHDKNTELSFTSLNPGCKNKRNFSIIYLHDTPLVKTLVNTKYIALGIKPIWLPGETAVGIEHFNAF